MKIIWYTDKTLWKREDDHLLDQIMGFEESP